MRGSRPSAAPLWLLAPTCLLLCLWLAALLLSPLSNAVDLDLSGFGTFGYARSDWPEAYQRFIDDGGTFERDSLLGVQLDARLAPAWNATLQATLVPAVDSESGWDPNLTWAFLAWRPHNDWLLRAGRMRLPFTHYWAAIDVGTTYEFARLPYEVYSLSPVTDFNGLSISKTWFDGDNEWTLDTFLGTGRTFWRFFLRDGAPPDLPAGPRYETFDVKAGGLALTLQQPDNTWRLGLIAGQARADSGPFPADYPFVPIAPDIGYYQISADLPGPGIPTVDSVELYVGTIGADIGLPRGFRLVGEYARRYATNIVTGLSTDAAYLALLKPIGRWTPYVYWAAIRSEDEALDLYRAMNDNRVPDDIPGAAAINASQRLGADQLSGYDQDTWAIGSSYDLAPGRRLKAEWARTRAGAVSYFLDVLPGGESGDQRIDVLSLSFSFSF